jgi:large conductance mechanosensitive channel
MGRREHTHHEGATVVKEFREFLLRGNVVDLAVAVILGAAFGAVVTSFVNDVLMQIIAIVFSEPDFGGLTLTINDSVIRYGSFFNAVLTFVIIGAAVFFFVVKPINELMERFKTEPDPEERTRKCPECWSDIPAPARRCAFCAAEVEPEAAR